MLDKLHQLMFFGCSLPEGLLCDNESDQRWLPDIFAFDEALSEATKTHGAIVLDFSGTDLEECRVAARHQPTVGVSADFVCAVDITDPDELSALLSCADSNVLLLAVMYDSDDETMLEA